LIEPADHPIEPCGNLEDVFYLPYTSGTTGAPKGVMQSHCTYLYGLDLGPYGVTHDDIGLVIMPVALHFGLIIGNLMLWFGCTFILMERYNCQEMIENIIKYNVTFLPAIPPFVYDMVHYMDENKGLRVQSLLSMPVAGAATPPALIKKTKELFGCTIYSAYGMTENSLLTTTKIDTPVELVSTTVGLPFGATELDILDDQGRSCPKGVMGEIAARGPSHFLGYYGESELTAASHTADGWLLTGDLGIVGDDGYLRIVGRKKEMIIRGGANIDPKEVEELLLQHPKVGQVAVIGLPDERLGERVCACIIPKSADLVPTLQELVTFLRSSGLASQKLPERVEIMKDFPRTATMKVQKFQLRKQLSASS
jgi:acyl-CoA synthetase (AMP-forming)/AMP-acid ligase II